MAKTKIHYPQWNAQAASLGQEVDRERLVDVIALSAEACGQPLSGAAAELMADDLSHFDCAAVLGALGRCRLELDGPLRIVEVLARIDDGRPDADEAWSMLPADEYDSVVWTEEIAHAWGVAQPLLAAGEVLAARAAFEKAYDKSVLDARMRRQAPCWTPSLGLDTHAREPALRHAVAKGRTSAEQAEQLLGHALANASREERFADQGDSKSLH